MMVWEQQLRRHIRNQALWYAFAAVFLLGAFMRHTLVSFNVADMKYFYAPWIEALQDGGVAAILQPDAMYSYSPLHLYLWALAAKLLPHGYPLMMAKIIVLVMEAAMDVFACMLVWHVLPKARRKLGLWLAFTLLWLNPVLLLNAAGWGQTDASYAALCLLSLYLLFKNRPSWAMVAYGFALSFKLQAVLFLPVLMIAYFCRKQTFSLLWFLLAPAIWLATGIPMALFGESPLYALTIYMTQTDISLKATFNCPNAFALLGDALSAKQMTLGMWQRYGMVMAVGALGGMGFWLVYKRRALSDRTMLLVGAWCVLACIFFLPRMHERYGIVGEVLLLLWAVTEWKPRAFLWVLLGLLPTLSAYCEYMFREPMFSLQLGAVMNLVLLGALTWELVHAANADPSMPEIIPH
ncbi:MAG: glycosyltransferase 87 family protein [Eubacteriales bacterium]|nr:glycosyltransferase 87 family protein [Eubacteriales bacterium]